MALARQTTGGAGFGDALASGLTTAHRILEVELGRLDQERTKRGGLHSLPVPILVLVGKFSARNSAVADAKSMNAQILPIAEDRGLPIWLAYAKMLEGEVLAAQGQEEAAIELFEEALVSADFFQMHESMARAYEASGNLPAALAEHAWMIENRGRAFTECFEGCQAVNAVDWNLAFYHLARLHERAGNRQKAALYYRQFMERWPGAEGLSQWQDAQRGAERVVGTNANNPSESCGVAEIR